MGTKSVCVENYNKTMVSFKVTTLALLATAISLCSADNSTRLRQANWAEVGQFPWQVSIRAESIPSRGPVFCSGTVITNYWVLTSATCISRASTFTIRYSSLLHYTGGSVYNSHEAYIHPFFNASNNQNNVALICIPSLFATTNGWLSFLPRSLGNPDLTRNTTRVVGWGRSSNLQQVSPLLQFAYGRILPTSVCTYDWNRTKNDRNDILCASFHAQQGCAGDTGSPLAVQVNSVWYLVGVAAFDSGLDICRHNTLFTPLHTFREWAANVTHSEKGHLEK